jgi:hypothetical protein
MTENRNNLRLVFCPLSFIKPYDMNRWLILLRSKRQVCVTMALLKAIVGGLILRLIDIGVSSQGI